MTQQPENDSYERIAREGQPSPYDQDNSQSRTARTHSQKRITRTGQPLQDRTTRTGQPGQDCHNRRTRSGQLQRTEHPGHGNQNRAAEQDRLVKTGQPK